VDDVPLDRRPVRRVRKRRPVRSRRRRTRRLLGKLPKLTLVLLTLALVGLLAYAALRPKPHVTEGAILAAQAMVKTRLQGAAVIRFNPPEWTHFEKLPDNRYYVTGWVETVGTGGRSASYTYTCTLFKNDDGDWAFTQFDLLPQ